MFEDSDAREIVFHVMEDLLKRDLSTINSFDLEQFLEIFNVDAFVVNDQGLILDLDGCRYASRAERLIPQHRMRIFAEITHEQELYIRNWLTGIVKSYEPGRLARATIERSIKYWQMRVARELPVER